MRFNVLSSRVLSLNIIQAKNTPHHHAPDCQHRTSFSRKIFAIKWIFQLLEKNVSISQSCPSGMQAWRKKGGEFLLIISVRDEDEKRPDWCISSVPRAAPVCQSVNISDVLLPAWGGEMLFLLMFDVDNVALIFMLVMSFLGNTKYEYQTNCQHQHS